jgi:hypothetical protein
VLNPNTTIYESLKEKKVARVSGRRRKGRGKKQRWGKNTKNGVCRGNNDTA